MPRTHRLDDGVSLDRAVEAGDSASDPASLVSGERDFKVHCSLKVADRPASNGVVFANVLSKKCVLGSDFLGDATWGSFCFRTPIIAGSTNIKLGPIRISMLGAWPHDVLSTTSLRETKKPRLGGLRFAFIFIVCL